MQGFWCILAMGFMAVGVPVFAGPLDGYKQIKLLEPDGTAHIVGHVEFAEAGPKSRYDLVWDDTQFGDHFLSMRPFKCLEGTQKYWCQVPYPYAIERKVSADDLTDLEYDTMFLWKGATEYGINMWNGVYYKLSIDGDRLVGQLHEVNMEPLGVPPEEGEMRPIRASDLHESDPDSHWLPAIIIE